MKNMAEDLKTKEALFNEVKGSLFEFLVASELAKKSHLEIKFLQQFDKNYLYVLSQQDRMIREFYPEMLSFLKRSARLTSSHLQDYLGGYVEEVRVIGKMVNAQNFEKFKEADLIIKIENKTIPVSLKLSKKNAFVNTKSGGVKSFFQHYFSYLPPHFQTDFNDLVEKEFFQMAVRLHHLKEVDYPGDFSQWVKRGYTELPGKLEPLERDILKRYYSTLAQKMFQILLEASQINSESFKKSLVTLMGFSSKDIIQATCFHRFPSTDDESVYLHTIQHIEDLVQKFNMKDFAQTSSVEILMESWCLQIRLKPMNKFTTPSMKVNCSVKMKN